MTSKNEFDDTTTSETTNDQKKKPNTAFSTSNSSEGLIENDPLSKTYVNADPPEKKIYDHPDDNLSSHFSEEQKKTSVSGSDDKNDDAIESSVAELSNLNDSTHNNSNNESNSGNNEEHGSDEYSDNQPLSGSDDNQQPINNSISQNEIDNTPNSPKEDVKLARLHEIFDDINQTYKNRESPDWDFQFDNVSFDSIDQTGPKIQELKKQKASLLLNKIHNENK